MSAGRPVVCVYAPSGSGGHALYAWELTRALARHPRSDYRFELVSSVDLAPQFRTADYPVHPVLPRLQVRSEFRSRLGWVSNRLLHYPRRERQFLKWLSGRPDVAAVHLQEWKPWLAHALVRGIQRQGKRVYFTVHNVRPHRYPAGVPRPLVDHWIRRASLACDGLFVHSQRLADELADFLGILTAQPPITVVPHGVWTVPDAGDVPPLAQRLASKRLLFFGAIRRNKGPDLLLGAARRLPGYSITLAGEPCEGDYFRAEVLPRVRSLQSAGMRVELIDRFIPDGEVGELFRTHSAVVLPYTRHFLAQSGVVFMALAYGLPVVASRAGGLADLLGEYCIGTTFETGSEAALAAAVEELHAAGRRDELERRIAAARQCFTWHGAAEATLAGYSTGHSTGAAAPQTVLEPHDRPLGTIAAH